MVFKTDQKVSFESVSEAQAIEREAQRTAAEAEATEEAERSLVIQN